MLYFLLLLFYLSFSPIHDSTAVAEQPADVPAVMILADDEDTIVDNVKDT